MQNKIQKIDDNNKIVETYDNLMIAAKSINTKIDTWKVALTIAYAITHNKRAYKSKWKAL